MQASVGETTIDTTAIIFRQNIELTNVPVGTCRVVFDRVDFGNFLVHPLMTAAAATAVQVRAAPTIGVWGRGRGSPLWR
jgi:hypothetical protein